MTMACQLPCVLTVLQSYQHRTHQFALHSLLDEHQHHPNHQTPVLNDLRLAKILTFFTHHGRCCAAYDVGTPDDINKAVSYSIDNLRSLMTVRVNWLSFVGFVWRYGHSVLADLPDLARTMATVCGCCKARMWLWRIIVATTTNMWRPALEESPGRCCGHNDARVWFCSGLTTSYMEVMEYYFLMFSAS